MLSNLISQSFCFCFRNSNLVSLRILLFITLFVYFYSFFIVTPFTFVVLYTLFHLYGVFKGCLKVMNSFKLGPTKHRKEQQRTENTAKNDDGL